MISWYMERTSFGGKEESPPPLKGFGELGKTIGLMNHRLCTPSDARICVLNRNTEIGKRNRLEKRKILLALRCWVVAATGKGRGDTNGAAPFKIARRLHIAEIGDMLIPTKFGRS